MRLRIPLLLVYNIDRNLLSGALGLRTDQGPDLLGNSTLTADHLTHVVGGDTQLQRQFLIALNLRNGDGVGIFHQVSGDVEQQFLNYAAKVENLKPAAGEWEKTKWYMMPQVKALVGRYSKLQDEAFYRFYLPIDNEFQTALTEQ